jgi:hypothetical protein
MEKVNHPLHYGGKDNPYEAIKVIEAWDLGFNLGNVVKYISRAGKKGDNYLEDLRKAKAYIEFEIIKAENCATPTERKDITSADITKLYKKGDKVISLSDKNEYVCSGSFSIFADINDFVIYDGISVNLCLYRNGTCAEKIIEL